MESWKAAHDLFHKRVVTPGGKLGRVVGYTDQVQVLLDDGPQDQPQWFDVAAVKPLEGTKGKDK